jgi:hypothetical protein
MKGRLLTVEEIKNLKPSDKKYWVESNVNTVKSDIYSSNGLKFNNLKGNWIFDNNCELVNEGFLKIYEWLETTYKTSEMIAMLEVNPKLRFEGFIYDNGVKTNRKVIVSVDDKNSIWQTDIEGRTRFRFRTDEEWTLVKPEPKPVSFMEAAEAHDNGKTIICESGKQRYIYKPALEDKCSIGFQLNTFIIGNSKSPITSGEIIRCKWFIAEEDTKC